MIHDSTQTTDCGGFSHKFMEKNTYPNDKTLSDYLTMAYLDFVNATHN